MTSSEEARLANLHSYNVLDTEPEECFDRITRVAKSALRVPIALVSLVDADRQWFKSKQGLEADETPREISFCTYAIREDIPFIVDDATKDDRFRNNPLVTGNPNIRFYAGIPLKTPKGFNLGTLCVIDMVPRELTAVEVVVLQDLARLVVDELELRQVALTDSLTGAETRRSFETQLDREIRRTQRYAQAFSLIMVDLDHFKAINDTHGHCAGDIVLQTVAARIKHHMRGSDIFARIGGEEFVLILPETGRVGAEIVAERLREAIASEPISIPDARINVTGSLGIATFTDPRETAHALLDRTDTALYQAKRDGRNRIAVSAADVASDKVA